MSELQDLIARSGHLAYEAGKVAERNAILKVLEKMTECGCHSHQDCDTPAYQYVIDTIIHERESK
jgi:hypothetical protein